MKKKDSTIQMGAHAESEFTTFALEQRWEVAHPFIKAAAYDALIRRSPEVPWETVQIKRAYWAAKSGMKKKYLEVGLRRSRRYGGQMTQSYKDGDFDWLFVFHEDGKWLLPWDLIRGRRSAMLIGSSRFDLWRV